MTRISPALTEVLPRMTETYRSTTETFQLRRRNSINSCPISAELSYARCRTRPERREDGENGPNYRVAKIQPNVQQPNCGAWHGACRQSDRQSELPCTAAQLGCTASRHRSLEGAHRGGPRWRQESDRAEKQTTAGSHQADTT